jgi:hypothetical protein
LMGIWESLLQRLDKPPQAVAVGATVDANPSTGRPDG